MNEEIQPTQKDTSTRKEVLENESYSIGEVFSIEEMEEEQKRWVAYQNQGCEIFLQEGAKNEAMGEDKEGT